MNGAEAPEPARLSAIHRTWVRRASQIVILGQALAFLVGAVLPTTADRDRAGLLLGALMVAIGGAVWFLVVPRETFGRWRIFIACLIAQTVLMIVLASTDGIASFYFPFLAMPMLIMVMAGTRGETLLLGAIAIIALGGLALFDRSTSSRDAVRDLFALRALEIGTLTMGAAAASRATAVVRDQLSELASTMSDLARRDPLTGLGNRQRLDEDLSRLLAAAARAKNTMSVVAIDLDEFKGVNDKGGHAAGDRVLRAVADVLRDVLRGQDVAIRAGGDEFLLLLPETDSAGALRLVERIRTHLETIAPESDGVTPRFSAGIASTAEETVPVQLLATADSRLYTEKARRGLHRVGRADPK